MPGVPLECILMLGYAISLALIALLLEWVAGHAHRRSLRFSTAGFTYHPDRDIWRCPRDQHLFPVFSDSATGRVIYRAPAATCNACPSKAACTDSSDGREIQRSTLSELEHGMKRFHRVVSLTLLVLASLILVVELFRTGSVYPRIALASTLTLFCGVIQHLSAKLFQDSQRSQSSQNADV
jgi:heme A synthase